MSTSPFLPGDLLGRLAAAEVRFVLVGGLAVSAWGYVRGTRDVDIVPDPDPDNLERLGDLLVELNGRVVSDGRVLDSSAIRIFLLAGDNALVRTDFGEVDVLQGLAQVPRFAELASRASEANLDGVRVNVCSLEDLRAMKRAAGRPRDLDDLEGLDAADQADA